MVRFQMKLKEILGVEDLATDRTGHFALGANLGVSPITELLGISQVGKVALVKRTSVRVHWQIVASKDFVEIIRSVFVDLQRVTCGAVIVLEVLSILYTSSKDSLDRTQ